MNVFSTPSGARHKVAFPRRSPLVPGPRQLRNPDRERRFQFSDALNDPRKQQESRKDALDARRWGRRTPLVGEEGVDPVWNGGRLFLVGA